MDIIRLLVTLDQHYFAQLQVLLTSLRLNQPGERLALYLIHRQIPEELLEQLTSWCVKNEIELSILQAPEEVFQSAPVSKQYPREMYYRLLAGNILPKDLHRILYLDPDILVINPLRPLWETDIDGYLFAAAAHTGKTELANDVNRLRLGVDHPYYNSGVLLMNLDRCRQEINPEKLFADTQAHRSELVLPDQDLLNLLYGNQISSLSDALWNYDARNYSNYLLRSGGVYDWRWVMEHTSILHFCGKAKPWKPGYLYRFGILYGHYQQLARRDWGDL